MEIYRWEGKGFRQLDPMRFEEERDLEDLLEQDPNLLLGMSASASSADKSPSENLKSGSPRT